MGRMLIIFAACFLLLTEKHASRAMTGGSDSSTVVFLAATPTSKGPASYPAVLYAAAPGEQKLRTLRTVVDAASGVEFVRWSKRLIVLGSPHISPTQVTFIHADSPLVSDAVQFPNKGTLLANALALTSNGRMLDLFWTAGKPSTWGIAAEDSNSPSAANRLIADPSISTLIVNGTPGGRAPLPWEGSYVFIHATKQGVYYSEAYGGGILARGPVPSNLVGATDSIACMNESFIVLAGMRDMRATHFETAKLQVYDRGKNIWFDIDMPGALSPVRLFSSWMAAVQVSEPTNLNSSGYVDLDSAEPAGKLWLFNLASRTKSIIETHEPDSEVLLVQDGTIWYRVRDALWTAQLVKDDLESPHVVAVDASAVDIHWAMVTY